MKKLSLWALLFVLMLASSTSFAAFVVSKKVEPTTTTTEPSVNVQEAMKAFNSLSRKEKKEKVREAKKVIKQFKEDQKNGNAPSTNTLLLVILALFIPPLAVYLHEGEINNRFWISLILTLLFFVTGLIYSLIVILGGA